MKNKQNPTKPESPLLGRGRGEAISSLEVINDYIDKGLLYIDATQPVVVVSPQLHLAVMDNERKASRWPWRWLIRHGWVERDKQYRRLMKACKLYIELPRGTMQGQYEEHLITMGMDRAEAHLEAVEKYPVHTGPLHFIVADPTDPSKPLLLGTYHDDRIALIEAGTPSGSSQVKRFSETKVSGSATDAHSASTPSMGEDSSIVENKYQVNSRKIVAVDEEKSRCRRVEM